jgi:hypothetical protein
MGMHEQDELTYLLQKIDQLSHPADMARRLVLCQQAVKLVSREDDPEEWANLQNEIGYSLIRNPKRDQAANIEQAIKHFEQALAIFDHHKNPKAHIPHLKNRSNNNIQQAVREDGSPSGARGVD